MRNLTMRVPSLLLATLVSCCIFPAAADDGKPRYVSGSGRDAGDCLNRFRPCRTPSYAIAHAGKGDSIQVAEGSYAIDDSAQLLDLLSATGRLQAGFSKVSGYSERNSRKEALLIGVPPEFRERFEAAGFSVIVDAKGLDWNSEESRRMRQLTAQVLQTQKSQPATPCVANLAGALPCESVSLLSHVALDALKPASTYADDVWGYTDLNTGREYVFIGVENGVAILDVTDPTAPEQVGAPTGSGTVWRDFEVFQKFDASAQRWRAYAYITADNVPDTLMLLDLSGLPNGIERVDFTSDHGRAHTDYLINADFTYGIAKDGGTPLLAIAGAGLENGNHRLYSLANPLAPALIGVSTSGYAHDLASFAVKDARKDTQCVNAATQPACQVLTDFNTDTFDIWDVTDPASRQLLVSQPYTNAQYTHSGWWTEDGRYLFVHDELDEKNVGLNTTVRVFDMADLRAPVLAGSWVGSTRAIDHNGYVRGNRYYFSNYTEGLTVLDITNPAAPTRVGYFDTFPASAAPNFIGAWGTYPFFPSGTIAISDMATGLYLVRDQTLTTPRGAFSMAKASLAGTEGHALTINVNRNGVGSGEVTVRLEVVYATASAADATLTATSLRWADGDTQPKSVRLNIPTDAQDEDLELLLVRLVDPHGGADIAYPDTTQVTIADSGKTARLRLLEAAPQVDEARAKAYVTVTRRGTTRGEVRANYRTIAGGTYGGVTPTGGELVWADGDFSAKTITVTLNPATLPPGHSGTFLMEIFNASNASLETSAGTSVTVLPVTVSVHDLTPGTALVGKPASAPRRRN